MLSPKIDWQEHVERSEMVRDEYQTTSCLLSTTSIYKSKSTSLERKQLNRKYTIPND
jgi:hypothetical protein